MKKIIDVDATWDGKGSLDDHRHKAFAKMEHPGFGKLKPKESKAAPVASKPVVVVDEPIKDKTD